MHRHDDVLGGAKEERGGIERAKRTEGQRGLGEHATAAYGGEDEREERSVREAAAPHADRGGWKTCGG